MAPRAEPSPHERIAALGFSEADTATLTSHFLDAESRGKLGHGLSRIDWLETLPDLQPDASPRRLHAEEGYERWDGERRARLPDAGGGRRRTARRATRPRSRDRRLELLPDRDARLVRPPARRRWPGRRSDGDVAGAIGASGRRRAAGGDKPARDRDPELRRRSARRRRLDGRRHLRRRAARRRAAGRARPVRRRAGAQGLRPGARAGAPRRRRSRARASAPCSSSRGRRPIPSRRCASGRRVYGSPATRRASRSSSLSAQPFSSGSPASARSRDPRASSRRPARARMQARWYRSGGWSGFCVEARVELGERAFVVAGVRLRIRGEEVLPCRHLVLAGLAAEREHGRSRLLGAGEARDRRIAEEDGRAGGHVDLVAVEDERRAPGDDDVELLVAEPLLVVLLDDVLAGLRRRVGVDPERGDPEVLPERRPAQRPRARQRLHVGQARNLVSAHRLLLSSLSTTGSISASPSTRSSRFASPAQSASRS